MRSVDVKLLTLRLALNYFDFFQRFCNLLFGLLLNIWGAKAIESPCEIVENPIVKWCIMNVVTEITSDEVKISDGRNENITDLWFSTNPKISFLPVEMHEKFPNIDWIHATYCSISTINKKNFIKLSKLRILSLSYNKIQKIESDTFDGDLVNLQKVDLGKSFLKFKG